MVRGITRKAVEDMKLYKDEQVDIEIVDILFTFFVFRPGLWLG